MNHWAGGTIFPGKHYLADFSVVEDAKHLSVTMQSKDGRANVHVAGTVSQELPGASVFESIRQASDFFEEGSLGYSETNKPGQFDGLELQCKNWQVECLEVESIRSSFFDDKAQFPSGSVEFDCALLMRNIEHEWHSRNHLCCSITEQQ